MILSFVWVAGWLLHLTTVKRTLEAEPSKALYFLHATFLMAATGALCIVLWSAIIGVVRAKKLSGTQPQSSQQKVAPKLASLEAVLKVSKDGNKGSVSKLKEQKKP